MEHEQVRDLIPAYALGALDRLEVQQIEAHLSQCAACQAELRLYQQVVEVLPFAAPQHQPPAALKQRILDRAARQPGQLPVARPSLWQALSAWLNRLAPAWGLVSLVLLIVLAVSNLWLWQRVKRFEAAERFHVIALAGMEQNPEASGLLVVSADGREGTLVVQQLPELDDNFQYQLWLIQDGVRTSGGVFSVNKLGYASLWVWSKVPLISYDGFGVTVEPFGGSPGPTGDKVLGSGL